MTKEAKSRVFLYAATGFGRDDLMAGGFDLGLQGKTAIICGSSAGLGKACAEALAQAGAHVILNGRTEARLRGVAEALAARSAGDVDYIVADVTRAEGRSAIFAFCPNPDILVNNNDGPSPGDSKSFSEADWHEALDRSMITPIMMMQAAIRPMMAAGWGRIINITSSAVRAPLPMLGLSNGARSGLTGFVAGLSREIAHTGVTINNLLPGRMETERLKSWIESVAQDRGLTPTEMRAEMVKANPMGRFGLPAELGAFCAFLASPSASYITGQNILLDGGEFPGI